MTGNHLDISSEVIVLDQHDREPVHVGGQLAFGPDGYLYVSLGDEAWAIDPYNNAQSKQALYGKVLRLAVTGQETYLIPPGNPFADGPGGNADEIFAYGFRNPWRFSFDSATGDIWLGDVGEVNYEEVNKVVSGGNYGWKIMEGFGCRGGVSCTPPSDHVPPRAVYCHPQYTPTCPGYPNPGDCAIIGGFVYRGTEMPELDGWYVYGDFCTGKMWALDTSGVVVDPVFLLDSPYNFSSFAQLPDGELLVLTYNNAICRLTPDSDADGVVNISDNCPLIANSEQLDTDSDGAGDACDPDDDDDLLYDASETACGSDPLNAAFRPERVDGVFAAVDDDGDTEIDEALPPGSEAFDCDGDGYSGTAEEHVGLNDQDPCGTNGWPSDFVSDDISENKANISDLGSFVAPVRRINTSANVDDGFDARWDLAPGSTFGADINVADLGAMISGASGYPPMLAGGRAFGGPECPWPP